MRIAPLLPFVALPVDIMIRPDTPPGVGAAPSAVTSSILPEEVFELSPLVNLISPPSLPAFFVPFPPLISTLPAFAFSDSPGVNLIAPLVAPVDFPVAISIIPLSLLPDSPVLNVMRPEATPLPVLRTMAPLLPGEPAAAELPLTPVLNVMLPELDDESPASGLAIVRSPLEVFSLVPLRMETLPPFALASSTLPALRVRSPPAPPEPVPPVILIEPLLASETPEPMRTSPLSPPKAAPELSLIKPVNPFEDVPVVMETSPLTPLVPAFGVVISISPLEVFSLNPLITVTLPPVSPSVVDVFPALMRISPPLPELPSPTVILMAPDRPLDAVPDPINKAPLLPFVEAPELIEIKPVVPPVDGVPAVMLPAVAVDITMFPLLVFSLIPLVIVTCPPD